MNMARTRRSNIPVESSWRMVEEGENDSFDTSIIRDSFEEDFTMSSGQSQQSHITSSSQEMASQDSIRDFADNADEDQVILRAPFQPSLVSTRHASMDKERTPVPEFFMPTVGVSSPRRASARSSKTIRPIVNELSQVRRRALRQGSTDASHRDHIESITRPGGKTSATNSAVQPSDLSERFASSALTFLVDCAVWALSVVGMALRFAKWPAAFLLAIYMAIGIAMVGKDVITQSASASLQPVCRIPGVSFLNLTFCPGSSSPGEEKYGVPSLEFDELMRTQMKFEKVLEESAQGVSLPMEMKRTEASVRDLRTVVKFSDLPARNELVFEFDGYIESVRTIVNDLQTFNTHVGGAVDAVININRWTSRYIDSVIEHQKANDNPVSRGFQWAFGAIVVDPFDERAVLEKYIEHTSLVSERIEKLILEAQAILRLLSKADDHLDRINELVVSDGNAVDKEHKEVFWNIWTILGANNRRLQSLKAKVSLLRQVDTQRRTAVSQLIGMVHDLGDIQSKLADLRDRVAAPQLLDDTASIPLSVHIETINAGVSRLESARVRIRAQENEKLHEALTRGEEKVPMIDA